MCLFIYKCLIYQIHCEVSFHSLVMKCWFLKGFNSVYIKISVHSMKEKQNFLLQMVVSNCLKLLKFALFQITTLISYCRDLQTVIYQFFFHLWLSVVIFRRDILWVALVSSQKGYISVFWYVWTGQGTGTRIPSSLSGF